MLKTVKLNAEYSATLKLANKGIRKVVRIPRELWEARVALFPYVLDGEFAVVAEKAKGGNRDFIRSNKEGHINLNVPYETETFKLMWNSRCEYDDCENFSMYTSSHTGIAVLVFPYHFKVDDNRNKLDFKHVYAIPTSEFINMQHIRIDSVKVPLDRSEVNWAWRTEEPTLEAWRYYPFFTPTGLNLYRVVATRNLTATEVKNHLHGNYPGVVEVPLIKDNGATPMEHNYIYYCASSNQVKKYLDPSCMSN